MKRLARAELPRRIYYRALELTNGTRFNQALKYGAEIWKAKYPSSDILVKELYRKSLGRDPQPKELAVAEKIVGKTPSNRRNSGSGLGNGAPPRISVDLLIENIVTL